MAAVQGSPYEPTPLTFMYSLWETATMEEYMAKVVVCFMSIMYFQPFMLRNQLHSSHSWLWMNEERKEK
jgi:hypothetical protein